jgi:hypothetical protein
MTNVYIVKNLFGYEDVISPPINLSMTTVYLTDDKKIANQAKSLGWDKVIVTNKFKHITDKFERRKSIAYINSFPLEFIDFKCNYIFICDSNVKKLWNSFNDFVSLCTSKHALFLTSSYYSGDRDTLKSEMIASNTERWSYNYNEICKRSLYYISKIGKENPSICSAKYIGWNTNHPHYHAMSNFLYNEYCIHLQGNIILTYMSVIFKDYIFNYKPNDYNGAQLNKHKYKA